MDNETVDESVLVHTRGMCRLKSLLSLVKGILYLGWIIADRTKTRPFPIVKS
jgi:hypothetical protein